MNPNDKSKWYETRRNELLGLLGEATALDIPQKYADELRETARKCQEDAFEIALVGEFQGGKSTTFDALCDGRDISPRGLGGGGIKTSAAVISAQNIAGDETKDGLAEWAEVTFKTKEAIALGLSTILRLPLTESEEFRQLNTRLSDEQYAEAMATDDAFPSLADLDLPECRTILQSVVDALWEKWRHNKSSLSDDELDQLRIATLQLRFFGTDECKRMIEKTVWPIDRFQKLITFPKDWLVRWMEGPRSRFELDEVAFVFVHSVLVRLHADNLRRLGCRITDCPGLFANAYDTAVARRTIRNADAVWYLINGEKQIGQKDLEIIGTIAAMGMLGKIEATCNLKGPHEQKMAEIIPATKAALENAGHPLDILPYNARLAFLAEQGKLLLNDPALFSELDRACMKIDAKVKEDNPPPETMWAKMVRRAGSSTELEKIEGIEGLDADAVAIVREESRLDGILSRLESEIIPQKATSILVANGSTRAAKALVAYEGVLKATEDAAQTVEEEWRARVQSARQTLADFVDRANTIIDRSAFAASKGELAQDMATDIVDTVLDDDFIDTVSVHVAAVLRIASREFYVSHKSMEKDIVAKLTPVLAEDFNDALTRGLTVWQKNADTNSRRRLLRSLENVSADIHDLWEDRKLDGNEMLGGFTTPEISAEDISVACHDLSESIMANTNIGTLAEQGRRGIFSVLWQILWPFLLGAIGGVLCFPLTMAFFAGKALYDLTRSADQLEQAELKKIQKEIAKILDKVRPEIARAVNDVTFRGGIATPLAQDLETSVKEIEDLLRKRLNALKDDFEKERVESAEKMFTQSGQERQRIAAENKAVRTGIIEPLRKRIEAFEAVVASELSTSA